MRHPKLAVCVLALGVLAVFAAGCNLFGAAGVVAHNIEREKKIEVLAEFEGLRNETVAVVVQADHMTLYEFPQVAANICANVSHRIQQNVEGSKVLNPTIVLDWTYRTPSWSAMPYGEVAKELGVDRLVWVDIFEFRLNPPGNRWIWEGVGTASVGIVESDGFDPDSFAQHWDISAEFPRIKGLGRESASKENVQTGLLAMFVQEISWLFYDHIEEKYPDK